VWTCVVWLCLTEGPGLLDPCEKDSIDAVGNLTRQQREDLTLAAQVIIINSLFQQTPQTPTKYR